MLSRCKSPWLRQKKRAEGKIFFQLNKKGSFFHRVGIVASEWFAQNLAGETLQRIAFNRSLMQRFISDITVH